MDRLPVVGGNTPHGFRDFPIQSCSVAAGFHIDNHAHLGALDPTQSFVYNAGFSSRVFCSLLVIFQGCCRFSQNLSGIVDIASSNCNDHRFILDALVGISFPAHMVRSNWRPKMSWRHYLILFIIGLLVPFAISRFQNLPGYMDADYYFAGGVELAKGNGFNEPYLWNYLDDPQGLPHPSHTYWMPLASIVSAIGMWIAGQTTYAAGRFPFILLSACVPVLTATLAFDISRNSLLAIISGLLSIFSLYYAPFMPVPDNYAIFMMLGSSFLLLAPRKGKWTPVALGALAGLMTLARSDGLLWLGLAGLTVMWKSTNKNDGTKNSFQEWITLIVPAGLLVTLGYLIVMGGWHYRSYTLFDSFMTPGGRRLLWLENYNQTFSYPADTITREGFLNAGWGAAINVRLKALGSNFGNTFAAQGGIFLFPIILIG
jgi:hypothetical protein